MNKFIFTKVLFIVSLLFSSLATAGVSGVIKAVIPDAAKAAKVSTKVVSTTDSLKTQYGYSRDEVNKLAVRAMNGLPPIMQPKKS